MNFRIQENIVCTLVSWLLTLNNIKIVCIQCIRYVLSRLWSGLLSQRVWCRPWMASGHCHRPFKLLRRCCYAVVPHSSRACLLACLHSSPDSLPAGSARALTSAPDCLWVAIRTLPSIAILVCRCGHCPYPLPPLSASNCPRCSLTNALPLLLLSATGCAAMSYEQELYY